MATNQEFGISSPSRDNFFVSRVASLGQVFFFASGFFFFAVWVKRTHADDRTRALLRVKES